MPSDSASAKPRSAATIVCEEVQLMAGYAKLPALALSSMAAYVSGVAMGIRRSLRECEVQPRSTVAALLAPSSQTYAQAPQASERARDPRASAREVLGQRAARRLHGVPHRRERRRVREVGHRELVRGQLAPQREGRGVDPLGRAPSRPTICTPSSRPVARSAITLTVIGAAPGKYPARLVATTTSGSRRRTRRPSACADVSPVRPTSRCAHLGDRGADDPGEARRGRRRGSRPRTRPCLFACVPSGTYRCRPLEPVAHLDAVPGRPDAVRVRAGGRRCTRPPNAPTRQPGSAARSRSRRTPRPSTTMSAGYEPPPVTHRGGRSRRRRSRPRSARSRGWTSMPSPVMRLPHQRGPCRGRACPSARRAGRRAVTDSPRRTIASAISTPM